MRHSHHPTSNSTKYGGFGSHPDCFVLGDTATAWYNATAKRKPEPLRINEMQLQTMFVVCEVKVPLSTSSAGEETRPGCKPV